MTYDKLFADLTAVSDYFIKVFTNLYVFINSQPLLVLAVFVTISLPAIFIIISFFSDLSDSSDEVTAEGFAIYKTIRLRQNKKKMEEQRKAFQREKINKQVRAHQLAQTFFENNPGRMSVSIMGHRFYQDGFENKHWGNSKKTRVTKNYKINENGEMYLTKQTISSSSTYDNTSSDHLEEVFDAD